MRFNLRPGELLRRFRSTKSRFFDMGYRRNIEKAQREIKGKTYRHRFGKLVAKPLLDHTAVTPVVKEYADKFPKTERGIVNMIEDLAKVKFIKIRPSLAKKIYGKMIAHEVIKFREVPSVFIKGVPDFGCGTLVDAVIAALKAKDIPAVHVRTNKHSVVRFIFNNRQFIADPFRGGIYFLWNGEGAEPFMGSRVVSQIGEKLNARIEQLKEMNRWREGSSLKDLVKNFAEYNAGL